MKLGFIIANTKAESDCWVKQLVMKIANLREELLEDDDQDEPEDNGKTTEDEIQWDESTLSTESGFQPGNQNTESQGTEWDALLKEGLNAAQNQRRNVELAHTPEVVLRRAFNESNEFLTRK